MGADRITRVTTQSWGSRLSSSISGLLFGFILVAASFPLLFWNEGRAVRRAQALREGAAAVVSVDASAPDAGNEGKLVHLAGRAVPRGTLTDPQLGVSAEAIRLRRDVEMYQWREESESETRNKLGGGTETVTTYTYERAWSSSLIDSSNFEEPFGHENPTSRPYDAWEADATEVTVGGFRLSASLIGSIGGAVSLPVTPEMMPAELADRARVAGGGFYLGADPSTPQVGDVRISFEQVPSTDVSIVARQSGGILAPYTTSGGGSIELLERGIHDAASMFSTAQTENTVLTWILRAAGVLIMWLGLSMIFRPLSVLADVVPILGRIVGAGAGLIALLLASMMSLVTIAIAWIWYRPLLGITLLVVAGGLVFLLAKRMRTPAGPAPVPAGGQS